MSFRTLFSVTVALSVGLKLQSVLVLFVLLSLFVYNILYAAFMHSKTGEHFEKILGAGDLPQ